MDRGSVLSRKRVQGFTLVEVVIAMGLISILGLSMMSLISLSLRSSGGLSRMYELYQLKERVMSVFLKDLSWQSTILRNQQVDDSSNSLYHFDALISANKSPPNMGPFQFPILNEGQPQDWYNASDPKAGFTPVGNACSTFNDPNPLLRDACPYRYEMSWAPVCPGAAAPPNCFGPTAQITATFFYSPGTSTAQLNPSRFNFTIIAGSPLVDLIQNCHRLGGQFNLNENRCVYDQTYCLVDSDFPFFRGWNPDGTPKCAGRCTNPSFPHLVGWNADDVTPKCGGCPNPSAPIFRGFDSTSNTSICESIIKKGNALGDNSNPQLCGGHLVARGLNPDGSLLCGPPLNRTPGGLSVQDPSVLCKQGKRSVGVDEYGAPVCVDLIVGAEIQPTGEYSCAPPWFVREVHADGSVKCELLNENNPGGQYSCPAGQHFVSLNADNTVNCAADATCLPGAVLMTSGCQYTGCPIGETHVGNHPDGAPECYFKQLVSTSINIDLPGLANKPYNVDYAPWVSCPTNSLGKQSTIWTPTVETWIDSPSAPPGDCHMFYGMSDFNSADTDGDGPLWPTFCQYKDSSNAHINVFPVGQMMSGASGFSKFTFFVKNKQVDTDHISATQYGLCQLEYKRTYPDP